MSDHPASSLSRRPLKTRQTAPARTIAMVLAKTGIPRMRFRWPASVLPALALRPWWRPRPSHCGRLARQRAIQLRLAANMLDGMVAIEGGLHSPTGALFNELPDRIEDSLLLVAAGFAGGVPALGWLAAQLACGTAYVAHAWRRTLLYAGFLRPQAKPQRMAALTLAALAAMVCPVTTVMPVALAAIACGTAFTLARRTAHLAAALKGTAA